MRRVLAAVRFTLVAAGQNFTRNLAVSMAGVFTMGLILLLVGGTLLMTHSIDDLLNRQQSNASKIHIYLQDSLSLATISDYQRKLGHDPRILGIRFINKDQAVIESKALGVDYQPAVNAVGSNPLPASFDVDVRQLADLSQIDAMARGLPIVDSGSNNQVTDYNKDVIPRLQSAIFWIRLIGIVLGVILATISLVIIMNTIRTAVYIRRTEIEIMKLVGATDWFVRWPFIIEGVLGGVLAAVFGGTVVAVAYRLVLRQVNTSFLGIGYDAAFLTGLLVLLLAVGAALGAFGSYLGVRRFLNV